MLIILIIVKTFINNMGRRWQEGGNKDYLKCVDFLINKTAIGNLLPELIKNADRAKKVFKKYNISSKYRFSEEEYDLFKTAGLFICIIILAIKEVEARIDVLTSQQDSFKTGDNVCTGINLVMLGSFKGAGIANFYKKGRARDIRMLGRCFTSSRGQENETLFSGFISEDISNFVKQIDRAANRLIDDDIEYPNDAIGLGYINLVLGIIINAVVGIGQYKGFDTGFS